MVTIIKFNVAANVVAILLLFFAAGKVPIDSLFISRKEKLWIITIYNSEVKIGDDNYKLLQR